MSYWTSGYNGMLGTGELGLPVQDGVVEGEENASLAEFAEDAELFRSFAYTGWTTSGRKRFFDTAIAVPALVAFLPLMGAVALLIKCTSNGSVLFRQERVGLGQKPFTIYKFRTMISDASCGPTVTRRGDCRLTTIGRILRKLKLDEIPQLYNVVRGDMSLVGPRPKLAEHEQMYLFCRPGITGAATLVFAHEEEILAEVPQEHVETYAVRVLNPIKAKLDLDYANSATMRSDLRLLLDTAFRLSRRTPLNELPEFTEVSYSAGSKSI
jgi:lipopolysaccharide/colanic/teichoic acid biosynthesis glycosyltransferase